MSEDTTNRPPQPEPQPAVLATDAIQETGSTKFPFTLFSGVVQYMRWVFSFKWYVILLVVIIVLFLIFQIEYTIETRRKKLEIKKENMQTNHKEKPNKNKKVTFHDVDPPIIKRRSNGSDTVQKNEQISISQYLTNIYNWWILPRIYLLFRNIGFRNV